MRLFARLRELAGVTELSIELPAEATLADLRRALVLQLPSLESLLRRSTAALGDKIVTEETVLLSLEEGRPKEVAFLPPVSGGTTSLSVKNGQGRAASI